MQLLDGEGEAVLNDLRGELHAVGAVAVPGGVEAGVVKNVGVDGGGNGVREGEAGVADGDMRAGDHRLFQTDEVPNDLGWLFKHKGVADRDRAAAECACAVVFRETCFLGISTLNVNRQTFLGENGVCTGEFFAVVLVNAADLRHGMIGGGHGFDGVAFLGEGFAGVGADA